MWLTSALFLERMQQRPDWSKEYEPLFTLDHDREGYISARKTFVATMDPTGYKWAMEYLGDWHHFLKLMEQDWFAKRVAVWKAEIEIILESEALDAVRSIAADESDKNRLTAARFLHSVSKPKPGPKRGRPSKEEVDGLLKAEAAIRSEFDEDAERLGLTVINGGKA